MRKSNNKIIAIIIMAVSASIGLLFLLINNKYDYSKLLEDTKYDIVYDKITTEKDKVPYINMNNEVSKEINQEIDFIYENYLLFSPDGFSYKYNISGSILSIIITAYVVHPESSHYDIIYKSYNIDLKTSKLLTNNEILKRFKITEEKMKYFLNNKFYNYYKDLYNNGYFTEEQCSFKEFLESKNVDNLMDDNYFYINNNHLELYKYFNVFTDFHEENYFTEDNFHFIIT